MESGKVIHDPDESKTLWIAGTLGVVFKLSGQDTGGSFALVEHPIQPGTLAAPLHTHHAEDEYSYVLEGEVGAQVGEQVVHAGPGALIVKPRNIPHTFWNSGPGSARVLEIISPAGFERYFEEVAPLFQGDGPPNMGRLLEVAQKYQLEMDLESIPSLVQRHRLRALT